MLLLKLARYAVRANVLRGARDAIVEAMLRQAVDDTEHAVIRAIEELLAAKETAGGA